jgi:hypothetical protein
MVTTDDHVAASCACNELGVANDRGALSEAGGRRLSGLGKKHSCG